jgi:drug/metabolite transporter (DMT)-like permease
MSGVIAGITIVLIRKLGPQVHYISSIMSWCTFNTLITIPVYLYFKTQSGKVTGTYSSYEFMMLAIMTIGIFGGQYFQTRAYQVEKAGRVAPATGI